MTPEFRTICGSQFSMTEIVKAHKQGRISLYQGPYDLEIIAENSPVATPLTA
jgi:hypothetical protein